MRRSILALAALLLVAGPAARAAALDEVEEAAVRAACQRYVDAWLANDRAAVLATLTDDAVLMPAHGRAPVVGRAAIDAFWWPPGSPPATIDAFTAVIDEAGGVADLAWTRGSFELTFTYEGQATTQRGTYLMLLRRQRDGVWRISHRMWDDRGP